MSNPAYFQHPDVDGYTIVKECFSREEISRILQVIQNSIMPTSSAVYAIRHLLAEAPGLAGIIAHSKLIPLLDSLFEAPWFIVKSILFNKPVGVDWLVNRHQDAIINTATDGNVPGFTAWKKRPWGYSVQPPDFYLKDIITVRIHLDDCNENNGALKVLPGSHIHGILTTEKLRAIEQHTQETLCGVPAGGVLLMKPLIVHASAKNTSGHPRRVVHLECTTQELPAPLRWSERIAFTASHPRHTSSEAL